MTGPAAGQAPGIVKVRLLGAQADITAAVGLLSCLNTRFDLIEVSQRYPNRREAGARLYLTIGLAADPPGTGAQLPRRSAVRPHLTAWEDS